MPSGAVQQDIMDFLGICLKGGIKIKVVLFCQSVQDRPGKAPLIRTGLPA